MTTPVVQCRDVTIDIEGNRILTDVNITIEPGEFVAILGVNGSGKTTLMRAMLGLMPISSGELELYGTPLQRFHEWQNLAYVPQRLHSGGAVPVSVREVVGASLISPRRRFPRRGDKNDITQALEQVGLTSRRKDRFDSLSGGQQRRVMIAAALAKHADTYILDEPTAGVDADSQSLITNTFARLRDQGCTVLLVTHELGPFSSLATRIIVLGRHHGDESSVRYDGPPPIPDHLAEHVWHHSEEAVARRDDPGLMETSG